MWTQLPLNANTVLGFTQSSVLIALISPTNFSKSFSSSSWWGKARRWWSWWKSLSWERWEAWGWCYEILAHMCFNVRDGFLSYLLYQIQELLGSLQKQEEVRRQFQQQDPVELLAIIDTKMKIMGKSYRQTNWGSSSSRSGNSSTGSKR